MQISIYIDAMKSGEAAPGRTASRTARLGREE
jgi:hypothetical protein